MGFSFHMFIMSRQFIKREKNLWETSKSCVWVKVPQNLFLLLSTKIICKKPNCLIKIFCIHNLWLNLRQWKNLLSLKLWKNFIIEKSLVMLKKQNKKFLIRKNKFFRDYEKLIININKVLENNYMTYREKESKMIWFLGKITSFCKWKPNKLTPFK